MAIPLYKSLYQHLKALGECKMPITALQIGKDLRRRGVSKETILKAFMDLGYNRQQALLIYFKLENPSLLQEKKFVDKVAVAIRTKLNQIVITPRTKVLVSQETFTRLMAESDRHFIDNVFKDVEVIPCHVMRGEEIVITNERVKKVYYKENRVADLNFVVPKSII